MLGGTGHCSNEHRVFSKMARNYNLTGKCLVCGEPAKPIKRYNGRFYSSCGDDKCVNQLRTQAAKKGAKKSPWSKF